MIKRYIFGVKKYKIGAGPYNRPPIPQISIPIAIIYLLCLSNFFNKNGEISVIGTYVASNDA